MGQALVIFALVIDACLPHLQRMMITRLIPVLLVGLGAGGCADADPGCSTPAADFATLELTDCDGAALPLNYLSEHRAAWLFLYTGW